MRELSYGNLRKELEAKFILKSYKSLKSHFKTIKINPIYPRKRTRRQIYTEKMSHAKPHFEK